jgi:hypothetical protein
VRRCAFSLFKLPRSITLRIRRLHMRTTKDFRLNNQRLAELLRRRIEELNQQLATLNSERGRFGRLLEKVRENKPSGHDSPAYARRADAVGLATACLKPTTSCSTANSISAESNASTNGSSTADDDHRAVDRRDRGGDPYRGVCPGAIRHGQGAMVWMAPQDKSLAVRSKTGTGRSGSNIIAGF